MWSVSPKGVSALYTFLELETGTRPRYRTWLTNKPDPTRVTRKETNETMPSQTNKTALKQLAKTQYLVVSAKTQKPTVNDRLAKSAPELFVEGSGEAPPAPDWNHLQEWGIAALETSAEGVRQTDIVLRKSRIRLEDFRRDRDQRIDLIDAGHRALRQSFTGTYGVESLPLVGLDATPARALLPAREQMREVVDRMRDPQLASSLPEPVAGQKPIDLESVADARDGEIGDLEAKMDQIDELRKQTDEALVARDEALAKNRRVYSNVGRLLEGVYRLAGLDELADRIRATQRSARKQSSLRASGATGDAPGEQSATPDAEPDQQPEGSEAAQEGGAVT